MKRADDLHLRIATRTDVPTLVALVNRAFEHERWLIPGPRLHLAEATRELLGPAFVTIVASLHDSVVGSVRVQFVDEFGRLRPIAELGMLAVDPVVNGRGIGSTLVHTAELLARSAGCDAIELRCGRELGLEAYYAALGYERVGERYGSMFGSYRPFTLVTLRRQLAPAVAP